MPHPVNWQYYVQKMVWVSKDILGEIRKIYWYFFNSYSNYKHILDNLLGWLYFRMILNPIWKSKNSFYILPINEIIFLKFSKLRPQSASEILIEVEWIAVESYDKTNLAAMQVWHFPTLASQAERKRQMLRCGVWE